MVLEETTEEGRLMFLGKMIFFSGHHYFQIFLSIVIRVMPECGSGNCLYQETLYQSEHCRKVQVGNDQENAQSEKDSHSKNRGGKKLN